MGATQLSGANKADVSIYRHMLHIACLYSFRRTARHVHDLVPGWPLHCMIHPLCTLLQEGILPLRLFLVSIHQDRTSVSEG